MLRNRHAVFAAVVTTLLLLVAIPIVSAWAKIRFPQTKQLTDYLNQHGIAGGCPRSAYLVPPGKAVHPDEEGLSEASLGLGHDAYEMNNRLIEDRGCTVSGSKTSITFVRFDGSGLPLAKYRHWLESSILPEACQLAEPGDTIVEAIWSSGGSLWNAEASSIEFEDVPPLPVARRKAMLGEITALVGGEIVAVSC